MEFTLSSLFTMVNNYKLTVAYDGGEFFGWQKTKMGNSVEETLQKVLEQILQEPVQLQAASRTDRGVHALGQVVNFCSSKTFDQLSLNRLLPSSIAILSVEKMPLSFHPTLDAIDKEYHYSVCYGAFQIPQYRHFSWHHPSSIMDIEAMRQAAVSLTGTHDFSVFCLNQKKSEYNNCIRTIERIEIEEIEKRHIKIRVTGKTFFYKMVRSLVGTLVAVGKGGELPDLVTQSNRNCAPMTAPAHGLTLMRVNYKS